MVPCTLCFSIHKDFDFQEDYGEIQLHSCSKIIHALYSLNQSCKCEVFFISDKYLGPAQIRSRTGYVTIRFHDEEFSYPNNSNYRQTDALCKSGKSSITLSVHYKNNSFIETITLSADDPYPAFNLDQLWKMERCLQTKQDRC